MSTLVNVHDNDVAAATSALLTLGTAQSLAGLYPDLTVKYAARAAAIIPDNKSDHVRRALNLVLDHAEAANRVAPTVVRDALTEIGPFADPFPALRRKLVDVSERVTTGPDYWTITLPGTVPPNPQP